MKHLKPNPRPFCKPSPQGAAVHTQRISISDIRKAMQTSRDPRMKKAAKVAEGFYQKAICDFLQVHPKVAFVVRTNAGALFAPGKDDDKQYFVKMLPKGFPDLHGLLADGRGFYIEVKNPARLPKKRYPGDVYKLLSNDQKEWRKIIQKTGALWGIAWDVHSAEHLVHGWTVEYVPKDEARWPCRDVNG